MGRRGWIWFAVPAATLFIAFWLLPMAGLALLGAESRNGQSAYWMVLTGTQYWISLFNTVALSLAATLATLVVSLPAGRFLARHRHFAGRRLLISLLMFPLAFPGV